MCRSQPCCCHLIKVEYVQSRRVYNWHGSSKLTRLDEHVPNMEQIFQHNWTGALAIYATSPAQPLLTQVIKGVGQHSSKSSKGVWLKAASHARLRLHESEGSGSVLEVHLQEHLLLQCPLLAEQLSLCLIPSGSTSAGSILVLNPKQQVRVAVVNVQRTYACVDAVLALPCTFHPSSLQQLHFPWQAV